MDSSSRKGTKQLLKMAPVYIQVNPSFKGCRFEGGKIYKVKDTTLTWLEVFKKIQLPLEPFGQYWISNSNNRVMAVPEDKVQDFINEFRRTMSVYKVNVTEATKFSSQKHAGKTEAIAKRRCKTQHPGPSVRSSSSSCARIDGHALEASGDMPKASQLALFGTSSFVQAGPQFPNYPGFEEDVGASGADADFDDAASMLSQDSQDDGGDLKESISRKLADNISNANLVLAREEFQEMKQRVMTMEVARHIPRGLALLEVCFGQ